MKTYEELIAYIENNKYENVYFNFVDHNMIRLSCRRKGDQIPYSANTNIVITSFVMCYARLRLYEVSISLPLKSVLYYNTDSIIYHSANGDELIKCGPFFGQLKNELDADEHIVEFCSMGPKCYSYITNKKVKVVDLKGFKLKNNVCDFLFYKSMLEIVNNPGMEIDVESMEICRCDNLCIINRCVKKTFGFAG